MADPTKYKPHFNYSGWEAAGSKRPKPGAELDTDFANIERSINETIDALKDIRRSDGGLKNEIIGPDAFDPDARQLMESAEDAAVSANQSASQASASASSAAGAASTASDAANKAEQASGSAAASANSASSSAELARGFASDLVSQGNVPIYASAATVQGLEIPAGLTAIRTNGFAAPGDGGAALYVRGTETAGSIQSADGAWWNPVSEAFTSREAAEASVALAPLQRIKVYHAGRLLRYVRDATGTALVTGDGGRWSPDGIATLRHWGGTPGQPGAEQYLVAAASWFPPSQRAVINLEDDEWVFSDNAVIERGNIRIYGRGARVVYDQDTADFADRAAGLIKIEPPNFRPENESGSIVSENIPEGAREIKVASTAPFVQGQFIRIMSGLTNQTGEYFYGIPGSGGFNAERRMEVNRILSIVDGTTLKLSTPTAQSYDATSYTVYVDPCNYQENVEIEGVHFVGEGGEAGFPPSGNPSSPHGVSVRGIYGLKIKGCTFENFPRHQASIQYCFDVIVSGNSLKGVDLFRPENIDDDDEMSVWYTGVNFSATTNIVFASNTASNVRRPCDFQGGGSTPPCRNILIVSNTSYNTVDMQGCHICDRMTVIGNYGYGCTRMIYFRGKNLVLNDNYCEVSGTRAIQVGDASIASGIYDDIGLNCGTLDIKGNTVKGTRLELYFAAQCDIDRLDMSDNSFTGMVSQTVNAAIFFLSRRMRNVRIKDNLIDCSEASGTIRVIDNLRRAADAILLIDGFQIEGNTIKGGTVGIRLFAPHPDHAEMGVNNAIIQNNTFMDQSSGRIAIQTGGTYLYKRPVVIKDNVSFGATDSSISGHQSYYEDINNTWNVGDL